MPNDKSRDAPTILVLGLHKDNTIVFETKHETIEVKLIQQGGRFKAVISSPLTVKVTRKELINPC